MTSARARLLASAITALLWWAAVEPASARAPLDLTAFRARLLSLDPASGAADDGAADAASPSVGDEVAPVPALRRSVVAARRGATLMDILTDAAVPRDDAGRAISALSGVYDPRRLRAGQAVTMLFKPDENGNSRFVGLEIAPNPARAFSVERGTDGAFAGRETARAIERRPTAVEGEIRSSLFEAGTTAGVPVAVLMEMIRLFSHEVDFQRDVQPGDRFAVLFEDRRTSGGEAVGSGGVMFASLTLSGKAFALYRFENGDRVDHYNADGESVRRALLRTPIDGARLTSGFGSRKHPILGYTRAHKGLDFGAAAGTPIYAAGRGVVETAGRNGAYGNYVRIRHDAETESAYGHMSRIAPGLSPGFRVDQGQVIGFVGQTGLATGPHLHYEVLRDGRQIDPRKLDLPTGEKLEGRALAAFKDAAREIDRIRAEAIASPALVSARPIAPRPDRADGGCGERGC